MAIGLGSMDMPVPSVVEWEWFNWRFPRQVHSGDTIYARWTLTQKRPPARDAGSSIVVWRVDIHTADGALCAEGEVGAKVRRVGAATAKPRAEAARPRSEAVKARSDAGKPRVEPAPGGAAQTAAPRRRRRRRPSGNGQVADAVLPAPITPAPIAAAVATAPPAGTKAPGSGPAKRRRRRRPPSAGAQREGEKPAAQATVSPAPDPTPEAVGATSAKTSPIGRVISRLRRT